MSKTLDGERETGNLHNGDTNSYVQRLDLSTDPFAESFESDYFFSGAMRRQQLEQLVHFSRFSNQVVMLLGATGSGSSTLLDQAYSQLQELMDCCYINAEEDASEQQLLIVLDDQLHLNLESPINTDAFISAIQSIAMVDGQPEPILLAIDQAHFLSMESYQLLLRLVLLAGDTIRLVFAGEYQCEQLITLAQFNKKQLSILELELLTEADTAEYVLGFLQSVAYAGVQPLSTEQLDVLHQQSGGNLADIKLLLPALLMEEKREEKRPRNFPVPLAHIAVVVILTVAIVIAWHYQDPSSEKIVDPVNAETTHVQVLADGEDVGKVLRQFDTQLEGSPLQTVADVNAEISQAETAVNTIDLITSEAAVSEEVVLVQHGDNEESYSEQLTATVAVENLAIVEETSVINTNIMIEEDLSEAAVETNFKSVTGQPADVSVSGEDQNTETTSSQPEESTARIIPLREQRLLDMPKEAYVLQLMGSVDERRARKLVEQYTNQLPLSYFETKLKARPWFVVVTGPYADKQAANNDVQSLPQLLQKQGPWARSVGPIQDNIRSGRQ